MTENFRWILNDEQLQQALGIWAQSERLFLDTEFMRERTYHSVLALIQVNDGHQSWLIDPLTLSDPAPLMQLLKQKPLILHACSEDVLALQVWGDEPLFQVEDTQIAAAFCGYDLQAGYQKLVKSVLNIDVPKDVTRSNWLQRPLSQQQIDYAVLDVEYLPALYSKLSDELQRQDRFHWWQLESQRLVSDALTQTPAEQLWRSVKGAGSLDTPEQRGRLQTLAAWRDGCARARDLPRSFVLKDLELLALVQRQPQSAEQLKQLGLHPSAVRRYGEQLLQMLSLPIVDAPPALPGPPDAETRKRVKKLKSVINGLAETLNLPPELLARRRWLEALAADPKSPPVEFEGWRAEVILPALEDALNGNG